MKLVFFPSKVGKFLSVTVTQYRLIKCGISDFTIENSLMNFMDDGIQIISTKYETSEGSAIFVYRTEITRLHSVLRAR